MTREDEIRAGLHSWCRHNPDRACQSCADFMHLLAEVERLRSAVEEVRDSRDQWAVRGEQAEVEVERLCATAADAAMRIRHLSAKRDQAEAKVARVEALADQWEALGFVSIYESATELAVVLRDALDGDA